MFKNIFSFEGRIRRTEYGLSFILHCVFAAVINTIVATTFNKGLLFLYIPSLWFLWAQGAKRCHDLSKNGWWQIIPFYGLWLIFQDGFPGINEYGPSPKFLNTNLYTPPSTPTPNDIFVHSNNSNSLQNNNQYSGGYNGGHNSIGQNENNLNNSTPKNGEYHNGNLYN